jgi:hypothetical protein
MVQFLPDILYTSDHMKNLTTQPGQAEKPVTGAGPNAPKAGITKIKGKAGLIGNDIKIIATAVLTTLAAAGCGEAFTSGNTDAGVTGGGGVGGSAGEAGAVVGGAGQGGTGGGGAGSNGGGGFGGGCQDVPVVLHAMEQFEYKVTQGACNGPEMASSLNNQAFETGTADLCLPAGFVYKLVAQVKDHAHNNTLQISFPGNQDSAVSSADFTTLVTQDPMDDPTAYSICTATSGTMPCVDLDMANTSNYACSGNPGGSPPVSSGFDITIDLNQ